MVNMSAQLSSAAHGAVLGWAELASRLALHDRLEGDRRRSPFSSAVTMFRTTWGGGQRRSLRRHFRTGLHSEIVVKSGDDHRRVDL
jgi:hypothetical protein